MRVKRCEVVRLGMMFLLLAEFRIGKGREREKKKFDQFHLGIFIHLHIYVCNHVVCLCLCMTEIRRFSCFNKMFTLISWGKH